MHKGTIQKNNINFSYLYSSKDIENLHKYFKMKDKYDYIFSDKEENDFINEIIEKIGFFDTVIYPETSGRVLPKIAERLGSNVIRIEKNSKLFIKEKLLEQKMMKDERLSLLNVIENEMDSNFKINLIKGNQRKRFVELLFKPIEINIEKGQSVLLLDDSIFSGETFLAMKHIVKQETKNIVLFSKL